MTKFAAKCLTVVAISVAALSSQAQNTIPFEDTFESGGGSVTDANVGWTWADVAFSDAACSAGSATGSFGPFSDEDPSDYLHPNNNFQNCGDNGGCYFRAGIVDLGEGDLALDVYGNQYSNDADACSQVNVFQEFPGIAVGDYELTATVQNNEFAQRDPSARVGVFFKVLKSSDETFDELQYGKQTVAPGDTPQTVTFQFTVEPGSAGELLQVGFYNETLPGQRNASALWDDVAIREQASAPTPNPGVGSETNAASIPTVPFYGLLLLSVLAGWLGQRHLRQRR